MTRNSDYRLMSTKDGGHQRLTDHFCPVCQKKKLHSFQCVYSISPDGRPVVSGIAPWCISNNCRSYVERQQVLGLRPYTFQRYIQRQGVVESSAHYFEWTYWGFSGEQDQWEEFIRRCKNRLQYIRVQEDLRKRNRRVELFKEAKKRRRALPEKVVKMAERRARRHLKRQHAAPKKVG